MKPNDEQVLAIRQYLGKHLKYSETRDEMFDHILTALEHVPGELTFGEAMNDVIKNIGGLKGIAMIERAAKMAAIRAMLKAYLETLKQIFTSPFVIVISVCTLAVYYLVSRFTFGFGTWFFPVIFMLNVPSFVVKKDMIRPPNLGHVKNEAFRIIFSGFQMLTPGIMLLSVLALRFCTEKSIITVMPYIVSITFCISFMQGSVFYKLSRKEFQVKLSDS